MTRNRDRHVRLDLWTCLGVRVFCFFVVDLDLKEESNSVSAEPPTLTTKILFGLLYSYWLPVRRKRAEENKNTRNRFSLFFVDQNITFWYSDSGTDVVAKTMM